MAQIFADKGNPYANFANQRELGNGLRTDGAILASGVVGARQQLPTRLARTLAPPKIKPRGVTITPDFSFQVTSSTADGFYLAEPIAVLKPESS